MCADPLEGTDKYAETGGVEEVDAFEVDDQVVMAGIDELDQALAELRRRIDVNLAPDVESIYLMASPQYSFLSSSGVKEIATFGGDVSGLVPEEVARRLKEAFER